MAAAPPLSKAEYLKRYLSGADAAVGGGPEANRKRRKKRPKLGGAGGKGMRIVDDDVSWTSISTTKPEKEDEEDDGDLPVVAEFVDERPEEVKQMEAFRSSAKWKLLGGNKEDISPQRNFHHDTPDSSPPTKVRHDTPDPSPPRRARHDTPDPSPPRRARHDTPDPSPPRRARHDTRDPSPLRKSHRHSSGISSRKACHDTPDSSPLRRARHSSSDLSPPRRTRNSSPDTCERKRTDSLDTSQLRRVRHDSPDLDPNVPQSLPRTKSTRAPDATSSKPPHRKGPGSSPSLPKNNKNEHDSDISPPRKKRAKSNFGNKQHDSKGHLDSDSDLSPPRNRPRHQSSDSDLSPPRRKRRASSDSDLSPPRRSQPPGKKAARMYSGAKTGLVLTDMQQEQQELKKREQETMAFEAEFQYAETVFRDKSGRKRNLKLERLEQRRKAEKDSERDELYAQWGKGLAQSRQQQQNVEDALKEMQKPLARYIDDEDLDRMLREQEREGDPMANFIKKNKAKENKNKKVRPRYNGPAPPPNRFNIWPGYRWDGVDRSNGFEQKRFARLASKKAVEELAYKWSVEDM
ncbi:PREDICTED: BUD13 homolog [Condylura cristata]|uniref:BUD13 homolog n=1 Tax=Condylura cristata TaxID=143302 RepID=UPI000642A714|nr:PREDICTED: BUD13 homolog [Condylura cristata]